MSFHLHSAVLYQAASSKNFPLLMLGVWYCRNNLIRGFNSLWTDIRYIEPTTKGNFYLSTVAFAEARKLVIRSQNGMIFCILFGNLSSRSVFNALTWLSKRAKRPVKSAACAEVLGSSAAAYGSSLLQAAYCKLPGVNASLLTIVDTEGLYATISTSRRSTKKAIKSGFCVATQRLWDSWNWSHDMGYWKILSRISLE